MTDFGEEAKTAIKRMLIEDLAGVDVDSVVLRMVTASVLVNAEIYVGSASAASSAASTLSSGVLASASALEAALTAQFRADGLSTANLAVEQINQAPAVSSSPSPPPGDADNTTLIIIAASIGGGVAAIALVAFVVRHVLHAARAAAATGSGAGDGSAEKATSLSSTAQSV